MTTTSAESQDLVTAQGRFRKMSRLNERLLPFIGIIHFHLLIKVWRLYILAKRIFVNSMSNAITSLEAGIAANPYDESSYLTLIPLIKVDTGSNLALSSTYCVQSNHLYYLTDRATVYREAYSVNFNAGLSFWLDWLADTPSTSLFEKALSSCPHFELANKYVEFACSLVEEEKMVSDKSISFIL